MKRKNDKKYNSNLTNSFHKALLLEDDEYGGATNHDILAFKTVEHIKNCKEQYIVQNVEALHRMLGESKAKLDIEVSGIEKYIKPILDEEKF